jgi:antitoxin (DNA-binding transcriptional repressor) of toxin-antitoxin stability system
LKPRCSGPKPSFPIWLSGRARRGEKIILTQGRKKTPVAEIVALKPVKERALGMFYHPDFDIPADFDELPEDELKAWRGECE